MNSVRPAPEKSFGVVSLGCLNIGGVRTDDSLACWGEYAVADSLPIGR